MQALPAISAAETRIAMSAAETRIAMSAGRNTHRKAATPDRLGSRRRAGKGLQHTAGGSMQAARQTRAAAARQTRGAAHVKIPSDGLPDAFHYARKEQRLRGNSAYEKVGWTAKME